MPDVSPYLVAIIGAWIFAQGAKFLIAAVRSRGSVNLRQLYYSGDMPSSHSATVVSLLTVVGIRDGTNGALFAVAALFAGIVMYDAVMVRRSSGEQGVAVQALIKEQKSSVRLPRSAKGHEPLEVAAGALIGLAVGLIVSLLTH